MTNPYQKIFVSHVAGIGKTVLALPALRALRHAYPDASITVASSYTAAEIIRLSSCANEIVTISRPAEIISPRATLQSLKALKQLRHDQFDLLIELHKNSRNKIARFVAQSGKKKQQQNWLQKLQTLWPHPKSRNLHAAQAYLATVSEFGAYPVDQAPKLYTDANSDAWIEQRLEKAGLLDGGILVGIHPGLQRNNQPLPLETYTAIANKLIQLLNARVLVFAGPNERGMAKRIVKTLPARQALPFESIQISPMISALARLSVFISPPSGLAHLAAAVGVPVVLTSYEMPGATQNLLSKNHVYLPVQHDLPQYIEAVFHASFQLIKSSRTEFLWTY